MAEYIEREALLNRLEAIKESTDWDSQSNYVLFGIKEFINNAPAADVAPVVHGEWEVYLGGKELMCSACKATFWDEDGVGGSKYCPNCGARMKGE